MGYPIGQSNISRPLYFLLVLTSDHITGATGKTPTVTLLKSGAAAYAAPAGAVTEIGNGIYAVAANATDANTVGPLLLHATAASCDPRDDEFEVLTDLAAASVALSPASTSALAITGRSLVTSALKLIGVLAAGETATSEDAVDGLSILNEMIDNWGNQRLAVPSTSRTLYSLTTAQSYTIGLGGTWNQAWPNWIERAGIIVTAGSVVLELPVRIVTVDQWGAIPIKAQTGAWPTLLYYDHAYASGLGTVNVWPKPDGTQSLQIALYMPAVLSQFASLDTAYAFAPGYAKALRYNLALELAPAFGAQVDPIVGAMAQESKGDLKRANIRLYDLSVGQTAAITGQWRGPYNIWNDC